MTGSEAFNATQIIMDWADRRRLIHRGVLVFLS